MIIKLFLVASALLLCWWLLGGDRRGSKLALTRLAGLGLAGCWIVAVLWPEAVTAVAQRVGVGRGTDLVLYVSVVAFIFSSVLQRRRILGLQESVAVLTRAHAILEQRIETDAVGNERPPVLP